ncbi:hypothetical protein ACP4OV_023415 [Aristida adscensionis]
MADAEQSRASTSCSSRTRARATSTRSCSSASASPRTAASGARSPRRGSSSARASRRAPAAPSASPPSPTAATVAASARPAGSTPTWPGWRRPGRRPWTSSSGRRRRGAGRCTRWFRTRSCRGRSAWRGVPCAAFFTQACAVDVAYAHAWTGRMALPPAAGEEKTVELPGLPAGLRPGDLPSFLANPSDYPGYLSLVLYQFKGLDTGDHVLVNSFHDLQPQESKFMALTWRAKTVGPTVPSAYLDNCLPDDTAYGFHLYTPLTTTTRAWLDAMPACSVVYVAFGSVATPSPVQMAEVAEGLYNCGKPFLWVVRASETSKIPENFADRVKERGLIVTWSPQLEVLAHPAFGCFLTHCGWNSAMEGLSAGVPMVAMSQWSDQPMNAKYIEDVWRVGVRVRQDKEGVVRKEEIERCIHEVMEGERSTEYQQNAAIWKEKAKRAVSEGGSSDTNIAEFLGKVGLKIK